MKVKVDVKMKRVLSPYFGQHLSASLNAADLTVEARHVGSSQTLKTETEDTVQLSPYFLGSNIETLNMERNEENDNKANDEENGKKTKSGKGQRRKAPIKVDYYFLVEQQIIDL